MERMIPPRETLEIEFKSDKDKLPDSDLIDAVVAFANTNGGDLYLGVEDNGDVTGLHPSHRDITQLGVYVAAEVVHTTVLQAHTVEHTLCCLGHARIGIPLSGVQGGALDDDAAYLVQWDKVLELQPVAKGSAGCQDGILESKPCDIGSQICHFSCSMLNTGPSVQTQT